MRVNDPAQDCEQHPDRSRRVSTVIVTRDGVQTSACGVGAPVAMALARAELDRRGECEHYYQQLDPRDRDTWGRTGLACVECGARPPEPAQPYMKAEDDYGF